MAENGASHIVLVLTRVVHPDILALACNNCFGYFASVIPPKALSLSFYCERGERKLILSSEREGGSQFWMVWWFVA